MTFLANIQFEINSKDWDSQVKKQIFTNAYQMADFYSPHSEAFGSEQFYIDVQTSTGEIVGQLTGVIHYQNFMSGNLGPTILWHHGPIIHEQKDNELILEKILSLLDELANKKKINFIQGSSPSRTKQFSKKLFSDFGYDIKSWITYVSDIDKDVSNFLSSLHNKVRYDIRKGETNNFTFEMAKNRYALDEYSELKLSENKNKDKIFKRNIIFRDKRWEISVKNGWERVYLARLNNEVVGGIANFHFNNNVIQHTIANSSNRKSQAGSFLTWNTIKSSIESHFHTYDMGGANPNPTSQKETGIKHFKSKWNGEEFTYYLYNKVFNKSQMKIKKALTNPSSLLKKTSNFLKI